MADLNVACVVLAAGASRRFGSPKMLHNLPNGSAMINQTIDIYAQVFDNISVVVALDDLQMMRLLENSPVKIVQSPNSQLGMSQSIAAGVVANSEADAWVFALGDMPYVKPTSVQAMCEVIKNDNIVIPRFHERVGNPVGFGRLFKVELLEIKGDRGAKSVIQKNSERVIFVDTDDEGVVLDVDYPSAVLEVT